MVISGISLIFVLISIAWQRYVKIKSQQPALDREWVADCAKHGKASFKGSKVTLENVRDFTWKNKKEHNSKWIKTKVDIDGIRDMVCC